MTLTTQFVATPAVLGRAAELQKNTTDLMLLMRSISGEAEEAGKEAAQTLMQAGEVKKKQATLQTDREAAALKQKTGILQTFGVDQATVQQTAQEVAITQQAAKNLEQSLAVMGQEVEALSSVSITNPLQWIASQFKLEGAAARYNATAQQYNATNQLFQAKVSRLAQLQEVANKQAEITPAVSEAMLNEERLAAIELIELQAKMERIGLEDKTRGQRLSLLSQMHQLDQQAFGTQLTVANFMLGLQDRAEARADRAEARAERAQNRAFREAEFAWRKEERDQEQAARKKKDVDLTLVNAHRILMNVAPLDPEDWKSFSVAQRSEMVLEAKAGKGGVTQVGDSLSDSMRILQKNKAIPKFVEQFPGAQRLLAIVADEAGKKEIVLGQQPGFAKLKPEEKTLKAIDEVVKDWEKAPGFVGRQYNKLPETHPLRMQPIIAATASALKANMFAEYARKTAETGKKVTDNDVAAYGAAQVAAGKPVQQVAKELAQFFDVGLAHQYRLSALAQLGINQKSSKGMIEYPMSARELNGMYDFMLLSPFNRDMDTGGIQALSPTSWELYLTASAARIKATVPLADMMRAGTMQPGSVPVNVLTQMMKGIKPSEFVPDIPAHPHQSQLVPPAGQPSIYASPEEWARYRESQKQKP